MQIDKTPISVAYIARAKLPSTSANSVHVMKICEAFSDLCKEFCLIVPEESMHKTDIEESYKYYGVKNFDILTVCTKSKKPNISRYSFPLKAIRVALRKKVDYIVTRDPIVALGAVFFHRQVVLDLHGDLSHLCGRAYRMIKLKWFVESPYLHLVTITRALQKFYIEKYGVPKERITVFPDGYTAENFKEIIFKPPLQKQKLHIGYCGSYLKGKGLEIIYQMAISDKDNLYFLYGGTKEQAEQEMHISFPDNVIFGGYVPNVEIPSILNEMDILLLPNQEQQVCKGEDIGKVTSPLKMFEYMASGRVIIASDLPVLREILNDDNSCLVEANNSQAWLCMVEYINKHRTLALKKANKASSDVQEYTWLKRANKMLALVK